MTERLYYTDAYRTEFDAAIVSRDDGGRIIYLDRTAFPERQLTRERPYPTFHNTKPLQLSTDNEDITQA